MKVKVMDPPKGWRYGFPRVMPSEIIGDADKIKQWLLSWKYPESELDIALTYSRYWFIEEGESTDEEQQWLDNPAECHSI
jgi:hypothetical protein